MVIGLFQISNVSNLCYNDTQVQLSKVHTLNIATMNLEPSENNVFILLDFNDVICLVVDFV